VKKGEVKALFSAVRRHDNAAARALLSAIPELAHATAAAPPKKDDGQSPLQVAFKTANLEIASVLIAMGANVSFQETSEINEWTAPVLHDALRAVVFNAGTGPGTSPGDFQKALALLRQMLELGANANATDSYGNNGLLRALLDARSRLTGDPGFPTAIADKALARDLREVFGTLLNAGANPDAGNPKRPSAREIAKEPVLSHLLMRSSA
jgi:hypothetical protein